MKKKEERRGLAFRVTIEFLNEIFGLMKKRKYKLIPKDAQIHSISDYDICWDGYVVIMTSKEFPVIPPECNCDVGWVKVDKARGIIELKERG